MEIFLNLPVHPGILSWAGCLLFYHICGCSEYSQNRSGQCHYCNRGCTGYHRISYRSFRPFRFAGNTFFLVESRRASPAGSWNPPYAATVSRQFRESFFFLLLASSRKFGDGSRSCFLLFASATQVCASLGTVLFLASAKQKKSKPIAKLNKIQCSSFLSAIF